MAQLKPVNKIHQYAGLGGANFNIAIYIANRPQLDSYPNLGTLQPLQKGELAYIAARTSNHWRKVFNVFAKFIFELRGSETQWTTWQEYRDVALLQLNSCEALLFSSPDFSNGGVGRSACVHIISGKTYAHSLSLPFALEWQDEYFAVNTTQRVIVSPYLDYRQLSNARITQLVSYVKRLQKINSNTHF